MNASPVMPERPGGARRLVSLWRTSVRARLALTYAATLALALSVFATATGVYLTRSSMSRVDASLSETVQLVRQALADESNERSPLAVAAADAVREVHFIDRRVLIFDAAHRLLAVSDTAPLSSAAPLSQLSDTRSPLLAPLLTTRDTAPLATLGHDDAGVRATIRRDTYHGEPITVVVLREMGTDHEAIERFIAWLLATIPLALVFSGAGGYLLARASLAPALALAEQAERIGAASLDARLVVANPDDELGRLAGVLNALLARLQQSFDQQRTFMADASHELRTPIAVVRSAADVALAQDAADVGTWREAVRTVHVESVRMTRIVNDLFLLARADAMAQPVVRDTLYLEEIVTEAARAGRTIGRAHDVTVLADADIEAPYIGDASLIGRLLLNLVDNAVQFSPRGGVVHIALERCTDPRGADGHTLPGAWYRITVDDEGPGVDLALHATLFDRFARAVNRPADSERRANGGAGLGLAIARWIAESHGGVIWHDASRPRGARFVVLLREAMENVARRNSYIALPGVPAGDARDHGFGTKRLAPTRAS